MPLKNCRARIEAHDIYKDDLFAATPPLEAKKMLLALATTGGIGFLEDNNRPCMKIEFIDIRRPYYQAHARHELYVQLPLRTEHQGCAAS